MRRSLILTDEAARHPFLASLPPHVRQGVEPIVIKRGWQLTAEDVRSFLLAYCACLLAVTIFIA
jgi:chaperonin GroEL (HSP60 family)